MRPFPCDARRATCVPDDNGDKQLNNALTV